MLIGACKIQCCVRFAPSGQTHLLTVHLTGTPTLTGRGVTNPAQCRIDSNGGYATSLELRVSAPGYSKKKLPITLACRKSFGQAFVRPLSFSLFFSVSFSLFRCNCLSFSLFFSLSFALFLSLSFFRSLSFALLRCVTASLSLSSLAPSFGQAVVRQLRHRFGPCSRISPHHTRATHTAWPRRPCLAEAHGRLHPC